MCKMSALLYSRHMKNIGCEKERGAKGSPSSTRYCNENWVLTLQMLALCQICYGDWLMFETWTLESLCGSQFTLVINSIDKPNICFYSPVMQHRSFFRSKPPESFVRSPTKCVTNGYFVKWFCFEEKEGEEASTYTPLLNDIRTITSTFLRKHLHLCFFQLNLQLSKAC